MKILYVCKSLPFSYQGGIQTHTWKLSEWMVKMGHEVSILTSGSMKKGERVFSMGGRNIIELPYFPGRRLPFFSTVAEELSFNMAARKWLLKNQSRFDVIHLQGRSGNLFLKERKKINTPVITTFHGLIENEQKFSNNKAQQMPDVWLHAKMANSFENLALRNSNALIAVSDEMRRELRGRFDKSAEKTTKIYNGVDVPQSHSLNQATDPNLLLYVGRLTALKGIFELVEAMRKLPASIQLVMIGDGEDRAALEKQIANYGLQHRIVLTGGLRSAKVFEWINRSTALILPSYHETQGIVLLEANACGKPVIANGVAGMKEVVEHEKNGLLMPSNDPSNIVSAVKYLFDHPHNAKMMGLQGKIIAKVKFSWERIAEETVHLYGDVLARHYTGKAKAGTQVLLNQAQSLNLA